MTLHKLLIVEDEAVVALDLKIQLEGLGYDIVAVAASGEAAVRLAKSKTPDLVLMDVRLQGTMDGIQAAAAIRQDNDIPVIFLTSHSDDATVQRAARTAPYGYLTKPYQLKELRAGIEVALTKSRMERQLRDADRWFAHTLRCVDDGVIVTDERGLVRFMNPAAEWLTGWAAEAAVGMAHSQVACFGASATDGAGDALQMVLQRGRTLPVTHGLTMLARSGGTRTVDRSAGPIDDDTGRRLGAVLVLRDATERLAHESQLRASEERFRSAFDHAPLGMALVSQTGELLQVNTALCRLAGATAAEVKQAGYQGLVSEDDRSRETPRLQELQRTAGGVVQFETRLQRLDGGAPVPALASVSLTQASAGPSCYLYQLHDLRSQLAAAQQLADLAQERLGRAASELANQAQSEFLSRVSHEMRTPLNAVIGFAQLLQMQVQHGPAETGADKIGLYAQHIRSAGEHMLALVADLLDLNRVAQGTLMMVPEPVELARAVAATIDLLGGLAQAHGIVLSAVVAPDLHVLADPTRLRQVLLNLGSNAIKYNRQGGSVQFLAEPLPGDRVQLRVEDSGIGMTPEQMQRLFQPFDRLGAERTDVPGVGLGLAIARSMVAEMGGSLGVTSQPRSGTVAAIELPAAPAAATAASARH